MEKTMAHCAIDGMAVHNAFMTIAYFAKYDIEEIHLRKWGADMGLLGVPRRSQPCHFVNVIFLLNSIILYFAPLSAVDIRSSQHKICCRR